MAVKISDLEPELQEIAHQIKIQVPLWVGRASIAWNTLSQAFFDIYRLLSGMDGIAAKATYFVVSSDRSQRDMVSALVDINLKPHNRRLAKTLQKLIADANGLAGRRNDVLHVVFLNSEKPEKVKQFHERGHLKGKAGADLIEAIHKLTIECLDIAIAVQSGAAEILEMPKFQDQLREEALRQQRSQLGSEALAKGGGFGLLGDLAKTPVLPEETPGS